LSKWLNRLLSEEPSIILEDLGIIHKKLDAELVASLRVVVKSRKEIFKQIKKLAGILPRDAIKGPPFSVFNFITSVRDGYDVEIGFPVTGSKKNKKFKAGKSPKLDVLSLLHTGSVETVSQSYNKLYSAAYSCGLISDEFCRESYFNWNNSNAVQIEIQFVIHDWHALFADGVEKVTNKKNRRDILGSGPFPNIDSSLDERFKITKSMIKSAERLGDDKCYDVVSRCAHRFPKSQISKLSNVYKKVYREGGDFLKAVDAVIEFMADDPGWGEKPLRKGNIIYSSKTPRDPKSFEKATTTEEKRKAYCFCPIIRERLDKGMPAAFCYCGAGWYRQQWEGAISRPVKIEIVESLLKGDDRCQFAIYLPEDGVKS
jgi:effector-binding domain-containing protein